MTVFEQLRGGLGRSVKAVVFVTCALMVSVPDLAASQERAGRGLNRAQTFLVLRLAEALDLSTEEALRISEILRKGQQRRKELKHEGAGIIDAIHVELERQPLDPERLRRLTDRGNQVYRELALVPEQSFEQAQKLLTVDQQAKLILFRYEWMSKLKKELRRRQRR